MRSLGAVLAGLCFWATAGHAHDFWLQPQTWAVAESPVEVSLQVGHGKDRQRSPISASRLLRLEAVGADGSLSDLHPALHLGSPRGDFSFDRKNHPRVLLLVSDTRAESYLDAKRFNSHLEAEGLAEVIATRRINGQSNEEGSENYGRVAKALLAPGPEQAMPGMTIRPLGLELEIVPLADPYLPGSDKLPFEVLWRGASLPGAKVKLYDLADDAVPRSTCVTDSSGRCSFGILHRGSWLISVVWSTPNPAGSVTDFRTIFSTLTFGFEAS